MYHVVPSNYTYLHLKYVQMLCIIQAHVLPFCSASMGDIQYTSSLSSLQQYRQSMAGIQNRVLQCEHRAEANVSVSLRAT